jgi:O-antigen/teichoic acid export membrane protein
MLARFSPVNRLSHSLRFVAHSTASLYVTTIVTSVLGFAFWSLAAHLLPAAQVGDGSAVVSLMQLLSMLCVFGLNTLIISEVSAHPHRTPTLVATATLVAFVLGTVGAILSAVILKATSATYAAIFATAWAIPTFVVGVAVTTVTLVLDDAAVAARRASWQLRRNTVFAGVKLALIPLAVRLLVATNGLQLLAAWVFATLLSLWFVRGLVLGSRSGGLVDLGLIRSHGHLALRHHWLNVSVQAPRFAIVAIAAVIVGPKLTAAFYAAMLMVGFVTIIPNLLTTVLFALTAGDEGALREHIRFTLAISGLLAIVAAPVIYLLSGFALSLFSPFDLTARTAMWLLGLAVAPFAIKAHYVVVGRVRGQMGRAARLTTAGSVLEIVLASLGGWLGGITGISVGWLIAGCLEAALLGPTVYRAAMSHRDGAPTANEG